MVDVGPSLPSSAKPEPSGLGGWLVLVVIGQTIAPLRTIGEAAKNLSEAEADLA